MVQDRPAERGLFGSNRLRVGSLGAAGYCTGTGELSVHNRLVPADNQVERIGVAVGHLPNEYPFAQSSAPTLVNDDVLFESSDTGSNDEREPQSEVKQQLSSQQLLAAIANQANFLALYTTLTKRAMVAYEACHKANSVIRLKADLAALAL